MDRFRAEFPPKVLQRGVQNPSKVLLRRTQNRSRMDPKSTQGGPWRAKIRCRSQAHNINSRKSTCRASFDPAFSILGVKSASQERPRASQERPKSSQKGLDSAPGGLQRRSGERSGTTLEGFFRQPSPEHRFDRSRDVFGRIFDSLAKAPTCV